MTIETAREQYAAAWRAAVDAQAAYAEARAYPQDYTAAELAALQDAYYAADDAERRAFKRLEAAEVRGARKQYTAEFGL